MQRFTISFEIESSGEVEPVVTASRYAHVERSVLEWAFAELQAVKDVLADAGVETIPAESGVSVLRDIIRDRDLQIEELRQTLVELAPARDAANESARAEMIMHVKRAYVELFDINCPSGSEDQFRGMLDVLAKFLVVTGEADASEGHAVARRLCEVPDGEV